MNFFNFIKIDVSVLVIVTCDAVLYMRMLVRRDTCLVRVLFLPCNGRNSYPLLINLQTFVRLG